MMLDAGQYLQITEKAQLSGSPVTADKPIGVLGGNEIVAIDICCGDHAEQMLTPSRALGTEYVAAPHGDRRPEADPRVFRLYGAVDGTDVHLQPAEHRPADHRRRRHGGDSKRLGVHRFESGLGLSVLGIHVHDGRRQ